MAPSAVETTTAPAVEAPAQLKLHSTYNNAEARALRGLFRNKFDREAEEGKKGFAAAKV